MPALLDDVKAAVKVQPRANGVAHSPVQAVESPFNLDALQAYADNMAKGCTLPTINPQSPPLSEQDGFDRNGKPARLMLPRRACEVDGNGNVVFGTGPVVTPEFCFEWWGKIRSDFEQAVHKTLYRMSESITDPARNGHIDERSKVIHAPEAAK